MPLVLRTRGILDISPNTHAICPGFFLSSVISYKITYAKNLMTYMNIIKEQFSFSLKLLGVP